MSSRALLTSTPTTKISLLNVCFPTTVNAVQDIWPCLVSGAARSWLPSTNRWVEVRRLVLSDRVVATIGRLTGSQRAEDARPTRRYPRWPHDK